MTSAQEALERLLEGNRRFLADIGSGNRHTSQTRRSELAESQEPFAIILGCSDSRVPVEIVSVDSAQVYRGMDVGTAKLPEAERAAGVVAPSAGNHAQAVAFAARSAGAREVESALARRGALFFPELSRAAGRPRLHPEPAPRPSLLRGFHTPSAGRRALNPEVAKRAAAV